MKGLSVMELERNAQIAFNIRKIRSERGLSQAELAKAMGVSQTLIAMIETGARTLTVPVCIDMADVLGCSVGDIANDRAE